MESSVHVIIDAFFSWLKDLNFIIAWNCIPYLSLSSICKILMMRDQEHLAWTIVSLLFTSFIIWTIPWPILTWDWSRCKATMSLYDTKVACWRYLSREPGGIILASSSMLKARSSVICSVSTFWSSNYLMLCRPCREMFWWNDNKYKGSDQLAFVYMFMESKPLKWPRMLTMQTVVGQ